jgi:serine phosphatase RsbU (regulator of sigma subunit)
VTVCLGIVVFGALSIACRHFDDQTEDRLLQQQTDEAAALLNLSVTQYYDPLAAAARAAAATDGDPAVFDALIGASAGEGQLYTRVALFRLGSTTPVAELGEGSLVLDDDATARLLAGAASQPFMIVDLLGSGRILGYAGADGNASPRYVVYGERTLSPDPNVRRRTDEPFSRLDYAIYLGADQQTDALLGSSTGALPLDGRTATVSIPFGDTQLTFVTTPIGHLGSEQLAASWWIVLVGGIAISVALALLIDRMSASKRRAESLATINEELYEHERNITETLQLALVPPEPVAPPGTDLASRYWPAGTANLIGGDFYDVFEIGEDRWGIVIGDICGKGIEAGGLTGLVRQSIRTASRFTQEPAEMLRAAHVALATSDADTFCTACLIIFRPAPGGGGRLTVALGGHPQPLLRRADGEIEAIGRMGSILGLFEPSVEEAEVDVVVGDTLLLYTDGLTDAPGEQAVPLEEVIDAFGELGGRLEVGPLADSIRVLKRRRRPHGSSDDTALVVIRFTAPHEAGLQFERTLASLR